MKKDGIQTTVICPIFINTGMFQGVSTSSATVAILDEKYVCDAIVDAILRNKRFVMLPPHSFTFYMLKGLMTDECMDRLPKFFGLANSMDTFVGRK